MSNTEELWMLKIKLAIALILIISLFFIPRLIRLFLKLKRSKKSIETIQNKRTIRKHDVKPIIMALAVVSVGLLVYYAIKKNRK